MTNIPNPLLNSRLFDPYRWSTHAEVKNACDALRNDIGLNDKRYEPYVKMLLLDLYFSWRSDPTQYVSYSRDKNQYGENSRYTQIKVGYVGITKAVDALLEHGYITHHMGICYRDPITGFQYVGYTSRMRATRKLIKLIVRYKVKLHMIFRHLNEELIFLRAAKKEGSDDRPMDINYVDAPREVERSRKIMMAYNSLLQNSYIDIADDLITTQELIDAGIDEYSIDLSRKRVYRVFNNGSWTDGGRLYGSWWEECPSELRKYIVINGQPTIELDYSGIHINLLYAREGINYVETGDDPYTLEGYPHRKLNKHVMLISINAQDTDACLQAAWAKLSPLDRRNYGVTSYEPLREILNALKAKHSRIAAYIASGEGIKLQYQDAQIALTIIEEHTKLRIPILSVHDSFISTALYAPFLRERMKVAYGKAIYRYLNQQYNSTIETIDVCNDTITTEDISNNINLADLIDETYENNDVTRDISYRVCNRAESKQLSRYNRWKKCHIQYGNLRYVRSD